MLVIKQFGPVTYAMGSLQEILAGTGISTGVRALPNDVAGCTLEMSASGWVGCLGVFDSDAAMATATGGNYANLASNATVLSAAILYTWSGTQWVNILPIATTTVAGKVSVPTGQDISVDSAGALKLGIGSIKTNAGTYVGTGTAFSVDCGFAPTHVFIRGDSTLPLIFKTAYPWVRQSDPVYAVQSIEYAIHLTDTGFDVLTHLDVNTAGVTFYWVAISDNGANALASVNWQGNALGGRVMDAFANYPLSIKAAFIKRDNATAGVWLMNGKSTHSDDSYYADKNTYIQGNNIILSTLGTVNQWEGSLGEGTEGTVFFDHPDIYATWYRGCAIARNIPLPWEAECLIITRPGGALFWSSAMPSGYTAGSKPDVGLSTGFLNSVLSGVISMPASTNVNNASTDYFLIAFRKNRDIGIAKAPLRLIKPKAFIELNAGYIDCGTNDSLKISGPLTLEWFGICHTAALPTEIPLMFRSSGTDGAPGNNHVSFGITMYRECLLNKVLNWEGYSPLFCRTDSFQVFSPSTNLSLDAANTGIGTKTDELVHYVLSTDGYGKWRMYKNGRIAKLIDYDMSRSGFANVTGFSGHRMLIGARLRSTIDFASTMAFCRARIYSRELTASEAMQEFNNAMYGTQGVSGFVEEWDAVNATPVNAVTSLPATINSANNGTIVNGNLFK